MSDKESSPKPLSAASSKRIRDNSSGLSGGISRQCSMKSEQPSLPFKVEQKNVNPFKMPPDNDIFVMRDKQRQLKKQERERQSTLRVHEKMTYASQVSRRSATKMMQLIDEEDKQLEGEDEYEKEDPEFVIAVTKDRHVEKESLADYINKKREMFLVQYSLGVKRDEMRKLEDIAQAEERKLELAEQYLEEDAAMFDEFLKENDRNSVEAIKAAEAETKLKLEKVMDIKKINTQMMTVKSDISKFEDMLKEYQLYKRFLDDLTPNEWKDASDQAITQLKQQHDEEVKISRVAKLMKSQTSPVPSITSYKKGIKLKNKVSSSLITKIHQQRIKEKERASQDNVQMSDTDSGGEEEYALSKLYFSEPSQLLDIFAELEEHNLSLIQNSQETEEALEEMKQAMRITEAKMEKETSMLKDQINSLTSEIEKVEKRASTLEMKAKMFNFGEFKADAQEKMLQQLDEKVEDVYRSCIGDNEASISTLQMLTNIENRLEELFETIEMMPQDKVEAAEKAKEKERRIKLREEKMEQQRKHQEERVRKALERAKAEPKKKTGKKLIYRSDPPRLKKKLDIGADQATREEEELAYYFQW